MNKKALVIYASCGQGHKKAAEGISDYLGLSTLDFLDYAISPFIKKLYTQGYYFLIKDICYLWSFIFKLTELMIVRDIIDRVHLIIFRPFFKFIQTQKDITLVLTHFFPLYFLRLLKKKNNLKVIVMVTDLGVHSWWVDRVVDVYLVVSSITKERLKKKARNNPKIYVVTPPLRKGFRKSLDKVRIKKDLNFDDKPVLLILSSVQGNIPFLEVMLEELVDDFNLIFIYGRNQRAANILSHLKHPSIRCFPYYENIWEFMELASVIITKPGGLTTFEGVYKAKPLVFTHYIKGQEKINMDILVERGFGFYASSFSQLKDVLYALKKGDSEFKGFYKDAEDFPSVVKKLI